MYFLNLIKATRILLKVLLIKNGEIIEGAKVIRLTVRSLEDDYKLDETVH